MEGQAEERHPHAVGCCDLKHLRKSGYVMSQILRGFGEAVEALACSLRLDCLVLLLAVCRLRARAALKLGVLFARGVEVAQLSWLALAFHPPLVWNSG